MLRISTTIYIEWNLMADPTTVGIGSKIGRLIEIYCWQFCF